MSLEWKLVIMVSLIGASMLAGYACRKFGFVRPQVAQPLMTFVAVFGYPAVGFLSIWQVRLQPEDVWLAAGGAAHTAIMVVLGLLLGRAVRCERQEVGLLGIATGLGNTGFTMGAFVCYMLFGQTGLGLAGIVQMLWMPMVVLVSYPVARHYAAGGPGGSLARLILRSLFDWRSIGLPASALAVVLAACNVPFPPVVREYHVVDALMYPVLLMAYFSIGLRLHASDIPSARKLILALAGSRFGLGLVIGWALVGLTCLTAWPLTGLRRDVFLIEAFVPTAVTGVAVANMFDLKPRRASMVFVVNTLMYLLLVLPMVWWVFK